MFNEQGRIDLSKIGIRMMIVGVVLYLIGCLLPAKGGEFVVENKRPPSFTVVNRCPAPAAKPVKYTNGFNCGAGFCGANGGGGCPSCPNGNGTCACGPKTVLPVAVQKIDSAAGVLPVAVQNPTPAFLLPASGYSTCPNGNCPSANQPVGRFRLFR